MSSQAAASAAHWGPERERLVRLDAAKTRLVQAVQELSPTRDLKGIMAVVRSAARELTGADGATFVLREGDQCSPRSRALSLAAARPRA